MHYSTEAGIIRPDRTEVAEPVRFAQSFALFQKLKEDGRGKAYGRFVIRFSLADESGQTAAYPGTLRYAIDVWRPGRFVANDLRIEMITGSPGHVSTEDLQHINAGGIFAKTDQFYKVSSGDYADQIWFEGFTNPIKLKIDVPEWRYDYELWFKPNGLLKRSLYDGHRSAYQTFDLRS